MELLYLSINATVISAHFLSLHLIIDNYSTHKHKKVGSWIERRNRAEQKKHGQDRIVLHFTPTSSSWINLVERFFRDITQDCIRDGSFGSIQELVNAITSYLAERNLEPKAYKWKTDGKQILEKSSVPVRRWLK
jgi:transposase